MTRKIPYIMMLLIGAAILVACSPSPEEQATMTAAAWTATPEPTNTPTPTPIPYDLSLNVVDGEGNPIADAQVTFVEREETVPADGSGQLSWTNLEGDAASFSVAAQGYFLTEASTTLERGPNSFEIVVERDPFGLLSADACAPNETLLYIEDFQDTRAQGWNQIDFLGGGWSIGEAMDQAGNVVASNNLPANHPSDLLGEYLFDQAAWRLWYQSSGASAVSLNWLQSFDYDSEFGHIDDARYQVLVDTRGGAAMRRLELPQVNIEAGGGVASVKAGEWHFIEISNFLGNVQLWIDGKRVINYTDPRPLNPGTIGVEILDFATSVDTVLYFDSMSVCELTEPFASIYVAPPAEE